MKKIVLSTILFAVPSLALADNIGGCGWGTKLFDGNSGLAPQVLAVTTNGTSGNQTFGMTSQTSGCTRSGVVRSNWKGDAFASSNMTQLALDMSRGEGETLTAFADVLGVDSQDREVFARTLKDNFSKIFSSAEVTSEEMMRNLKVVLLSEDSLAKYV